MALADDCKELKLEALIGFNGESSRSSTPSPLYPNDTPVPNAGSQTLDLSGAVTHGLQYTPDGKYVVYPLGAMIVVKNLATDSQSFLEGHNNVVSTLTISHDGTMLASGELGLTPGTKVCTPDGGKRIPPTVRGWARGGKEG